MNRAQMNDALGNLLGETLGTPGGDNPYSKDLLLDNAADELARATYCFFTKYSTEIVNGQAEYCAPSIFRVTAVTARLSDAATQILRQVSVGQMDGAAGSYWRNTPETGDPRVYMAQGLNSVQIYPEPDYTTVVAAYSDLVIQTATASVSSVARGFVFDDIGRTLIVTGGAGFTPGRYKVVTVSGGIATLDRAVGTAASTGGAATLSTGGLTVEGYGVPSGSWTKDTDHCPLPERAHMAVVYGAARDRGLQFLSSGSAAQMQIIEQRYREMRGKLEREAATITRAQRHRARPF